MNEGEYGYKSLVVWQKSDELAYQIYLSTRKFPKEEIYGITSQLRRAATSVPANIVEGYSRQGQNELRYFANIALGSLAETRYLLDFSLRLKYVDPKKYKELSDLASEVGRLLWKFYKSL
jgi:four helix bundle protein